MRSRGRVYGERSLWLYSATTTPLRCVAGTDAANARWFLLAGVGRSGYVSSLTACRQQCSNYNTCVGISYSNSQKLCALHSMYLM